MSKMVDRAADAIADTGVNQVRAVSYARAALLAALNPEDENLVECIGFELADELTGEFDTDQAKRVITALRASIRSPHEHGAPQT